MGLARIESSTKVDDFFDEQCWIRTKLQMHAQCCSLPACIHFFFPSKFLETETFCRGRFCCTSSGRCMLQLFGLEELEQIIVKFNPYRNQSLKNSAENDL